MDLQQIEKIKSLLNCYGHGSGEGMGAISGAGRGFCGGFGYGDGGGFGGGEGAGRGYGRGEGSGAGCGEGEGEGEGAGRGVGRRGGYGYGAGNCYGEIWKLDNKLCLIADIDNTRTALHSIKKVDNFHILTGFIVGDDSLSKTYVVVRNGYFAHGETIKDAMQDCLHKELSSLNFDDMVSKIKSTYDLSNKIPAQELLLIHRAVTGSCRQGCQEWINQHRIDLDRDSFTMNEFYDLVKTSYGSDSIRKLMLAL